MRIFRIAALAAAGLALAASLAAARPTTSRGLHVVGNRLVDVSGHTIRLHGVNYSGTEYACIQGWGIFDGPSDAQAVKAIASWHVNAVRVPLNEDCWLGINGVKAQYAGAAYRNAIVTYVRLLHRYGMYAELSLMWAAPGSNQATDQPGAPDADHSPAMWASMASTFKSDPNVILAPWGETTVDADCFLRGGTCGGGYAVAGMQQAVTVMRRAGYRGVISIPGVTYANDLSKWLSHEPKDPQHQLVAEAHVYGKNTCSSASCFNSTFGPVAKRVPLLFGETGDTYDGSSCDGNYIRTIIGWADAHAVSYEAWTWDTWGNCSALIKDFGGTPNSAYASWIKTHYAATKAAARPLRG